MNRSTASSRLCLLVVAVPRLLSSSQVVQATTLRGQENVTVKAPSGRQRKLPPKWSNDPCKISGEKVGVYTGSGVCSTCAKWAESLAAFWGTGMRGPLGSGYEDTKLNAGADSGITYDGDASITYVTLTTTEIERCYNGELNSLALLMMPGGSAYSIQDALGSAGKAALTSFLDGGGSYIGFCAGGYYMARGYYWSGYDGAPADNCDEQFCRYGIEGTFSYDSSTQDFTVHEWNGRSYHSNLVAYGPLSNVFVEGPIEEIAGPWATVSNPNAPYDSHVVESTDPEVPLLRQIYWGGATENYIYTTTATSNWGTEKAYFQQMSNGGDLPFPSNLWTLKEVETGNGGKIIISSAHLEASVFYSDIGDGGMTECQSYNNYAFVTRAIGDVLNISPLPDYDTTCSAERKVGGEAKDTASLFPSGLAYQTAPRIGGGPPPTSPPPTKAPVVGTLAPTTSPPTKAPVGTTESPTSIGACGNVSSLQVIDFEDGDLVGALSGEAQRPWAVNTLGACLGSAKGITAGVAGGKAGGVDSESWLTITAPTGSTSMSYFYSYPNALDRGDDFHVYLNGALVATYENGSGATCASECVNLLAGDMVQFKCKSGGNNEICSLDHIVFHGDLFA